jgi:hypothetical protein
MRLIGLGIAAVGALTGERIDTLQNHTRIENTVFQDVLSVTNAQ